MGKKGSSGKKAPTATGGPQMSVTMREASMGKKRTNTKSSLKLQHIKNLAVWASHDAPIPSLGAFFGHHLASSSEALATTVDPSLFTCQRCESILHPGYNCTIRIEKNKKNARRKGKKTTRYPRNNIVYTCHFCSHRNMKRGTPRNTNQPMVKAQSKVKAQPKVKAHPVSTNRNTNIAVSSSDMTKDNANFIAAPLWSTADYSSWGKNGIVEINGILKVKNDSADVSRAAPLGSTAVDPGMGKMGVVEIGAMLKVKDDSTDIYTLETPLASATEDLNKGKMGIVEISETLNVNEDSADINTIAVPLGPTADDPDNCDSVNMGIVEVSETLRVKDVSADINVIAAPLEPTTDNLDRGNMGIVEFSETSKITDVSAAINTMAALLGSAADDPERGKMGIVEISETLKAKCDTYPITDDPGGKMGNLEISETMVVKNNPAESSPATPLTRPALTLLESKMKKRNRSGAKKKGASESRSEALTADKSVSTSKRKRKKSWTSLKEIAERDENDRRKRLMNVTVPFSIQ